MNKTEFGIWHAATKSWAFKSHDYYCIRTKIWAGKLAIVSDDNSPVFSESLNAAIEGFKAIPSKLDETVYDKNGNIYGGD